MNWTYNTLLLSNCKGSFIAEQELQQLLASLMLSSPIACKLGWQVAMAFYFCSDATAVLVTEVTGMGRPFIKHSQNKVHRRQRTEKS